MREYERRGCFDQVRDEFQAALRRAPKNQKLLNFGIAFFKRLGGESDATLAACKLRRAELEGFIDELLGEKERLEISTA